MAVMISLSAIKKLLSSASSTLMTLPEFSRREQAAIQ
jgi:hypothetical protein